MGAGVNTLERFDSNSGEMNHPEANDAVSQQALKSNPELEYTGDSVRIYLNQIGKTALLNAAEEQELAKRIEAGVYAQHLLDEDVENVDDGEKLSRNIVRDLGMVARDGTLAYNHLVEANLRLVVSLAKRYTKSGVPLMDLVQEGNKGLMHAADKFDYSKGYKFSTYATWWIRQAITKYLSQYSEIVYLPEETGQQKHKYVRETEEFLKENGELPTAEEMAVIMGIDEEKAKTLEALANGMLSLDVETGEGEGASFGDFIEDSDAIATDEQVILPQTQQDIVDSVEKILANSTLEYDCQRIVRMHYGVGYEQSYNISAMVRFFEAEREVQGEKPYSRKKVTNMLNDSLEQLRSQLEDQTLSQYRDMRTLISDN